MSRYDKDMQIKSPKSIQLFVEFPLSQYNIYTYK